MITYGIVTTAGREDYLASTEFSLLNGMEYNKPLDELHIFKDLSKGLTPNHISSWRELLRIANDSKSSNCLLFQDDIIASGNWNKTANLFIKFPVVSFYSGLGIVKDSKSIARRYVEINPKLWINEQALMMRADILSLYLGWIDSGEYLKLVPENNLKHHDVILRTFFVKFGIKVVLTSPSLFQHTGEKSTMGHPFKIGGRERKSQFFLGEDSDSFEWFSQRVI